MKSNVAPWMRTSSGDVLAASFPGSGFSAGGPRCALLHCLVG